MGTGLGGFPFESFGNARFRSVEREIDHLWLREDFLLPLAFLAKDSRFSL